MTNVNTPKSYYYKEDDYKDFWYMAGRNHIAINMGYIARNNKELEKKYTEELTEQLKNGKLLNDAIYVSKMEDKNIFENKLKLNSITCKLLNNFYVCKTVIPRLDRGIHVNKKSL